MGGIYASDADVLSASLIFNRKGLGLEPPVKNGHESDKTFCARHSFAKRRDAGIAGRSVRLLALQQGVRIELNQAAQIERDAPTVIRTGNSGCRVISRTLA